MSRHALPLGNDEVHVWSANLDRSAEEKARLAQLLSEDEKERLSRIRSTRTHTEFVVARGVLRTLLGAYLDTPATELRFALGPVGKPELSEPADARLHFNVSHSHGLALFAVTKCGPVGVDVEQVRPLTNFLGLAQRYYSAREVALLLSLKDAQRNEAFFHAWTRKEAFLKACGVGLSFGLERVEVTLGPGEPARMLRLDGDEQSARSWSLQHLDPAPGFIGALVLEHHHYHLVCRSWPDGAHF